MAARTRNHCARHLGRARIVGLGDLLAAGLGFELFERGIREFHRDHSVAGVNTRVNNLVKLGEISRNLMKAIKVDKALNGKQKNAGKTRCEG